MHQIYSHDLLSGLEIHSLLLKMTICITFLASPTLKETQTQGALCFTVSNPVANVVCGPKHGPENIRLLLLYSIHSIE